METMYRRNLKCARARMLIVALALLSCLFALPARAEADGMLRVKLARLGSPSVIELTADCDYTLDADPDLRVPAGAKLTVAAEAGSLTLSTGSATLEVGATARLARDGSGSAGIQFLSPALSNRFCGDLTLTASGDVVTAVLRIYVEDYLYGVVGYEMAPSGGLEALKAQAVVARNYALRQKAARVGAAYDLIDTGEALSYRGYSGAAEYADVLRAVDDTRGRVLCYEGSAATCYYCDSNGGQIESSANALGSPLPYSTLRDDPYDLEGNGAKKTASLRKDASDLAPELERVLYAAIAEQQEALGLEGLLRIDTLDAIQPGKARFDEPSRLYESLDFLLTVSAGPGAPSAQIQVSVPTYGGLENWYGLSLNDDDNETVWLSETDRAFEITFRRSGSGLGMSQRGAQAMARKGFSCQEILEYYYPGTELTTLSLAGDARDGAATPEAQPIASARLSQKTRLYASADESVAAITTLPAGATVEIYAVQGDWAALGSGGAYGFAHTDALTDFALAGVTAATVKNETVAKVGSAVNVLQLPVAGSKSLDSLLGGDSVRLNGYTDAWALVTTQGGVAGYIPRDALTLQAEGGTAADGEIVTAPENMVALLTDDAGLYVNADDSIPPRQTLAKGGYVQILAYNRAWAYARTEDGRTGFVKLSGLSPVQAAEAAARPAESAEGGEIVVVEGVEYRYVSADALPMFEESDSNSPVLATLATGNEVRLGAYNEAWACVRFDGMTGFVLLSGLTDQPPELPDERDDIEGGEITVVEGEQYATVVADCPLYPSYNADDAPLTRLTQGERVQLGAYNSRWACVRVDGVTGFMPIEALELSAAEEPLADDGVNYLECEAEATARLELYESADFTGEALAELNKGDRLHVYAFDRTAAYVEYNGVKGFVALRYLNKVD